MTPRPGNAAMSVKGVLIKMAVQYEEMPPEQLEEEIRRLQRQISETANLKQKRLLKRRLAMVRHNLLVLLGKLG